MSADERRLFQGTLRASAGIASALVAARIVATVDRGNELSRSVVDVD